MLGAVNVAVYIMLCLIWGSTWMAIKVGLRDAPPLWAAGVRMALAGSIMYAYCRLAGYRLPGNWKDKGRVAWPGIMIYGLPYALVYIGSQYISSAMTSILFAGFPFFVAALAAIVIKNERVGPKTIIGMTVGFAGIIIIFAGPVAFDRPSLVGAALVVVATAASAYGTVHVKAFLAEEPVAPMMAQQMTLGGILLLAAAAVSEPISRFHITVTSVASIGYLTIFGSIIAFGGYFWLLKRISAVTLSLTSFITPIIAVFIGYVVMGEKLTGQDVVGAALVLAGVAVTQVGRRS